VMRWRSICLIWQPFLSFSGGLWRKMSRSARCRQHRTISKHWSGNSLQRMAGGWISVWCYSSHSWRSRSTLLITNYCS
jgi:hypothetical protein